MNGRQPLSIRIKPETRRRLEQAAAGHHAAGASELAGQILERWEEGEASAHLAPDTERVAHFLKTHPDWGNDPAEFFPALRDAE